MNTQSNIYFWDVYRSEHIAQHASRAGVNSVGISKIKASDYNNLSDDDDYN